MSADNIKYIELYDLKVAEISVHDSFELHQLYHFDALLIEADNGVLVRNLVQQIRATTHYKFYMIPIVLRGPKEYFSKDTLALVDACIINKDSLESQYENFKEIGRRIESVINQ